MKKDKANPLNFRSAKNISVFLEIRYSEDSRKQIFTQKMKLT